MSSSMVRFSSNTDQNQCDAIRSMLDAVLAAPQDLKCQMSNDKCQMPNKLLHNGQLLILRGNKTFTLTGIEVQ